MVKIRRVKCSSFGAIWLIGMIIVFLGGCQTVREGAESSAQPKRNPLIGEVRNVRVAQQQTKDQFLMTLASFGALIDQTGGEVRNGYEAFSDELQKSESMAAALRERIGHLEEKGRLYFEPRESSLYGFTDRGSDQTGDAKSNATHQRYQDLLRAMKQAEQDIDPVLTVFRDQLVFAKYNLNAEAIARLQDELAAVEADTATLVGKLDSAIAEADTFIGAMRPRLFGMGF